ncbi:MAG: aminotransferase class I/II-fold pyridoxal phosphate-dependent enzyme [Deltaproteobacteria bacterium]|nr:aminotransferase class I/II-fold pyridoxal phosphate-dependent enzyme [Deltaproteobacteria bacterium]
MTSLAMEHDAVNLSQGFPDFEGPEEVLKAAAEAILRGPNQYVHTYGVPALRRAVADKMKRFYNIDVDPETQVTVTAGASEGLSATLLGLLDPGDEVILFEPCYDLYPPMIARAGAKAVYVSLEGPGFELPEEALRRAFSSRTRAILINNPMNPCGKVFTSQELAFISELCCEHDVIAIGDEVYEHMTYEGREHVTLLNVPGLEERCIVISSTAKTFSTTGWKIGYAVASPRLSEAVRLSHQFITFCTPGALQEAMALAIGMNDSYYEELHRSYTARRAKLCGALDKIGFKVLWPEGTYYVSIDIGDLDFEDDRTFCHYLTKEVGVAAIPTSFFYKDRRGGRNLARFCFCKTDETLDEAIQRLGRWKR